MSIEAVDPEPVPSEPDSCDKPQPPLRRSLAALLAVVLILAAVAVLLRQPLQVWRQQVRARLLLYERKDREALEVLRAALRPDLRSTETLMLLARTHRRLGNIARATALLEQAETLGGDGPRVERERRLILVQSGNLREAEEYLPDLLISAGEDGPDVLQAYVLGYFANLRTAEALQLLDTWEQNYPDDPQPLFLRAYLWQSLNDPAPAVGWYRQGLAMAPHQTTMRRRLAEVLLETGDIDAAEAELLLCIDQAPDDAEVHHVLARCAYARGDLAGATSLLDETLQRAPGNMDARRLKGQLELAQHNLDSALAELRLVVDHRPYDTLAREALGRTLTMLGRTGEARTHLDYVSRAEKEIGRLNRLLRESVVRPQDADLRYEVGLLLLQYGPPEDAAKWLHSALELQPAHAGAHHALAAYYQQRGDAAKTAFHQARAGSHRPAPEP